MKAFNEIEIWMPRYRDRVALVAVYKVGQWNRITFTKAKHLKDMVFEVEGELIRKYPIDSNGTLPCYAVDLQVIMDRRVK